MPPPGTSYWQLARAPRYSLPFALPLLLLYEVLAFALTHDAFLGVRNGADVILKSAFVWLGGRHGVVVFGLLLLGVGGWLVVRDLRRGATIEPKVYLGMLAESFGWALVFGWVAGSLMISLGAGLYEELLFRVLLVAGLAWLARRAFKWKPFAAGAFATVLGALVFSAFHYIGPLGDRLTLASFTFRAIAGLLFSALYLARGFGITAWTHALYDVMLVVMGGG